MPVTFVTGFTDLREDRTNNKSPEVCLAHFKKLAATGVNIHLFLSATYRATYDEEVGPMDTIVVETLELEDLLPYKALADVEYDLPPVITAWKDTKNFMLLMNGKTDMVERAIQINPFGATHFAWIDFAVFHVVGDTEGASAQLREISARSFPEKFSAFPGCWAKGDYGDRLFSRINWRHCGGFFLADAEFLLAMNDLYRRRFSEIVREKKCLAWEVNIWHHFELYEGLELSWYRANHNDSIFQIPG
jgi:hypothetical protein